MTADQGTTSGTAAVPREFFDRSPLAVAPDLLGTVIRHDGPEGPVEIRLTEVEAYLGEGADPASHAHRGPRPRTRSMFGPPGHLYLYFTYGMHWCANLVCGPDGEGGAVLLRAGQVVTGREIARSRRPAAHRDVDLARGPARLTSALGLGPDDDGRDVCCAGRVQVLTGDPVAAPRRRCGPRVGVSAGAQSPWRFWVDADRTVSAYRAAAPRRRG